MSGAAWEAAFHGRVAFSCGDPPIPAGRPAVWVRGVGMPCGSLRPPMGRTLCCIVRVPMHAMDLPWHLPAWSPTEWPPHLTHAPAPQHGRPPPPPSLLPPLPTHPPHAHPPAPIPPQAAARLPRPPPERPPGGGWGQRRQGRGRRPGGQAALHRRPAAHGCGGRGGARAWPGGAGTFPLHPALPRRGGQPVGGRGFCGGHPEAGGSMRGCEGV
jgi:hypothetical protein